MTTNKKDQLTLTDEDMMTSAKVTRRSLLAGAGVALGGVALAGRTAMAGDKDGEQDKDSDKDPEADTGNADAGADHAYQKISPSRAARESLIASPGQRYQP